MGPPRSATSTVVQVAGRQLTLTNLAKPLYPSGATKADVISYYSQVAEVILPHLRGRPVTMRRFPNGSQDPGFYAKNIPAGAPAWVPRVRLPTPGGRAGREAIDYVLIDEPATLVWTANLAALELHVPQWRVSEGRPQFPDLMVVDLDPGPPAGLPECATVALAARTALRDAGLDPLPKTSGSKGLQLLARLPGTQDAEQVSSHAHALAQHLERELPGLVVSRMTKSLRPGKVLVDWSQNAAAKTTVAPYSLRARAEPFASTPLTWEEVATCAGSGAAPAFTASEVLERVALTGDLLEPLVA